MCVCSVLGNGGNDIRKLLVYTIVSKFSYAKISSGKISNTTAYSCSYTEASGLLKALPFASSKKTFFLLGSFLGSFFGISLSSPGQRAYHAQDTVYMLV